MVELVTNRLWFVHAAALGEGFAVGLAHGVEPATLWEAITAGVGDSFAARHDAPSIFAGHYDPSFTPDLCLEDLGLLDELAAAVRTDLPLTTPRTRSSDGPVSATGSTPPSCTWPGASRRTRSSASAFPVHGPRRGSSESRG